MGGARLKIKEAAPKKTKKRTNAVELDTRFPSERRVEVLTETVAPDPAAHRVVEGARGLAT